MQTPNDLDKLLEELAIMSDNLTSSSAYPAQWNHISVNQTLKPQTGRNTQANNGMSRSPEPRFRSLTPNPKAVMPEFDHTAAAAARPSTAIDFTKDNFGKTPDDESDTDDSSPRTPRNSWLAQQHLRLSHIRRRNNPTSRIGDQTTNSSRVRSPNKSFLDEFLSDEFAHKPFKRKAVVNAKDPRNARLYASPTSTSSTSPKSPTSGYKLTHSVHPDRAVDVMGNPPNHIRFAMQPVPGNTVEKAKLAKSTSLPAHSRHRPNVDAWLSGRQEVLDIPVEIESENIQRPPILTRGNTLDSAAPRSTMQFQTRINSEAAINDSGPISSRPYSFSARPIPTSRSTPIRPDSKKTILGFPTEDSQMNLVGPRSTQVRFAMPTERLNGATPGRYDSGDCDYESELPITTFNLAQPGQHMAPSHIYNKAQEAQYLEQTLQRAAQNLGRPNSQHFTDPSQPGFQKQQGNRQITLSSVVTFQDDKTSAFTAEAPSQDLDIHEERMSLHPIGTAIQNLQTGSLAGVVNNLHTFARGGGESEQFASKANSSPTSLPHPTEVPTSSQIVQSHSYQVNNEPPKPPPPVDFQMRRKLNPTDSQNSKSAYYNQDSFIAPESTTSQASTAQFSPPSTQPIPKKSSSPQVRFATTEADIPSSSAIPSPSIVASQNDQRFVQLPPVDLDTGNQISPYQMMSTVHATTEKEFQRNSLPQRASDIPRLSASILSTPQPFQPDNSPTSPVMRTPYRSSTETSRISSTSSGPKSPVSPKIIRESHNEWYMPNITREEAMALLRDKPVGSFLIRDSTSFPNSMGLVVKVDKIPEGIIPKTGDIESELVRHYLVEKTSKGVRLRGSAIEPFFGSLPVLIFQHTLTPLSLPVLLILPERKSMIEMDVQPVSSSEGLAFDEVDASRVLSVASSSRTHSFPGNHRSCSIDSTTSSNSAGEVHKALHLGSLDVESLTGLTAIIKALQHLRNNPHLVKETECTLKVSGDGVTVTDNWRKYFFRRHYPRQIISFFDSLPMEYGWDSPEVRVRGHGKARVLGVVVRKSNSSDNTCHLFCECDPLEPINFLSDSLEKHLGS